MPDRDVPTLTIPFAFAAFLLHASVPTFLLAVSLGLLIDSHLHYLTRTPKA
jgi:hypothetical protein